MLLLLVAAVSWSSQPEPMSAGVQQDVHQNRRNSVAGSVAGEPDLEPRPVVAQQPTSAPEVSVEEVLSLFPLDSEQQQLVTPSLNPLAATSTKVPRWSKAETSQPAIVRSPTRDSRQEEGEAEQEAHTEYANKPAEKNPADMSTQRPPPRLRAPQPNNNNIRPPRPQRPPAPLPKSVPPPGKLPLSQYTEIVHTTCQCKQPFLEQYEAMFRRPPPKATPSPSPSPAPHLDEGEGSELGSRDEGGRPPPTTTTQPKQRRGNSNYYQQQYQQQARSSRSHSAEGYDQQHAWRPESYFYRDSIRRFLKNWYSEVMAYRKRTTNSGGSDGESAENSGDGPTTFQLPEARVLLIGDSLTRNMLYSFIVQALDEGVEQEHVDMYGTFARHVLQSAGDTYQTLYVTWPRNDRGAGGNNHNGDDSGIDSSGPKVRRATIKIRYEQEAYFSMDSHSLKSSRALEFNPTHIFFGRGMWDAIVRVRPFDPAVPLSGMSAGLVRLRKELLDHRKELPPKQRNLYPPTRVVYWAMPKMFGSWESHCRQCGYDKESGYFRDAYYAAVRRANGALLHLHGKEKFCSVAIELFDYYAMSMAAGARNTHNSDCIHPKPTVRLAILAQMLDLVSQPPRSQESVQQLVDEAQANNRVFLNATMYIPPPLVVRESDELTNTTCPLSFTVDDVDRILHPPKLVGVGAAAALSEDVEDLTPPPLQSIPTSSGKQLFAAMMTCGAPENMNTGTVRPVQRAQRALQKFISGDAEHNGGTTEGDLSPTRVYALHQLRADYISACAAMLYTWLFGHHTMMPFFTEAKKMTLPVDGSTSPVSRAEILWTGNRCVHFVSSEVAAMGRTAFFQQLWNYTTSHKMICAVPPLVAWTMLQPSLSSLNGGLDGGDELVRCAQQFGNVRIRFKR